jgi:capsular exopolysaccharide synthesis family protein
MSLPAGRFGRSTDQAARVFRAQDSGHDGPKEEESLRDLVRVLRKRKFFVLGCALATLLIGVLACIVIPDQYTSTATLLVDKDSSGGLDLGSLSGLASAVAGGDDLKTEMQTHSTMLQSETTVLHVVEKLGLDQISPYKYKQSFWGRKPELRAEQGLPLEKAKARRERIFKMIVKNLKVDPQQDSRLINVSFSDHDPERAADIANAFVTTYTQDYLQSRFQATAQASDWLSGQLNNLKSRVAAAQQKLSDYERRTGLGILTLGMGGEGGGQSGGNAISSGTQIPAVEKLATLNQELTAAEADRISKEAVYRLTQTKSPDVVLGLGSSNLTSGGAGESPAQQSSLALLQSLRQQQASLQMAYADALTKYGARNPHLAQLEGQMTAIKKAIGDELQRINERARNDFELARQTEDGIRKAYLQQEQEVNKLNNSTIQLEVLAGEALSSRRLYEELYGKLQEASIQAGVRATNLNLVDVARPSATPTRPNWMLYPAVGLGVGLLLGIGGAFVWENLDDTIVTPDQVEQLAWFPVLTYIPQSDLSKTSLGRTGGVENPMDPSLLVSRPNSPEAEAYRVLRTSILLSTVNEQVRTLLVTSPLSGDGKTTVCYNLAVAFAQHGKRVLLVDADMRKPRMHYLFRLPKSPGLSNVLSGMAPLTECVRQHPVTTGLSFLPAGTSPPNPAELLGAKRFDSLLEESKQQFDLVIIDSPPVLLVTDPVAISMKVDGTIVVVRSRSTTRPILNRAAETLARSDGRKLGFVVNGVDTNSVEYYYSYGYYGNKEYYEEEA